LAIEVCTAWMQSIQAATARHQKGTELLYGRTWTSMHDTIWYTSSLLQSACQDSQMKRNMGDLLITTTDTKKSKTASASVHIQLYSNNDYHGAPHEPISMEHVQCLYPEVYAQRTNDLCANLVEYGFTLEIASLIAAYDGRLIIYNALYHPWMSYSNMRRSLFPLYNVPTTADCRNRDYPMLWGPRGERSLNMACATLRGASAHSSFTGFASLFTRGDGHHKVIPTGAPIFQAAYTFDRDPEVGEVIVFSGQTYLDPVAAVQSFLYKPNSSDKDPACLSRVHDYHSPSRPEQLLCIHDPQHGEGFLRTPFDTLVVHLHKAPVAAEFLRNNYMNDTAYYSSYSKDISHIRIVRDHRVPMQSTVVSTQIFNSEWMAMDTHPYKTFSSFDYIRVIVVQSVY
jgi:hypothetical protein